MTTKRERALEILQERKNAFLGREYFEAVVNETLPQYFLDRLQLFKMYSDDLPGERLVDTWHSDYPMMKCRGNVIVGISATLRKTVIDGIIKDVEMISRVKYFSQYNWSFLKGAKGEYWTQPEEIDLINYTLETVIGYLKKEYVLKDNTDSIKQRFQERLIQARRGWRV